MKVPKLRFKNIKNESFPDWKVVNLGDNTEVIMGQSPSSSSYNERKEGLPLVQGKADIHNRITNPKRYTTQLTKIINKDSVLLSVRAPVGEVSKVGQNKIVIGRGMASLNSSNNDFLYQLLLSIENKWKKLEQGSTFTAISKKDIDNFIVLIPSEEEQKKIADFLTTVDNKIKSLKEKLKSIELLKKELLRQIFSREIRFKDENGNDFPKWEVFILAHLSDIYQPKTIGQNEFINSGFPVYGANGKIGYYGQYNHETEQIAICCRGASCGVVNFIPKKSWITGNAMVVNTDKYKVNKKYLYYFLLNFNLSSLITGSGQPQITRKNLLNLNILIPSVLEQQKIVDFLDTLSDKYNAILKKLDHWKNLKKGLLQQLFPN